MTEFNFVYEINEPNRAELNHWKKKRRNSRILAGFTGVSSVCYGFLCYVTAQIDGTVSPVVTYGTAGGVIFSIFVTASLIQDSITESKEINNLEKKILKEYHLKLKND